MDRLSEGTRMILEGLRDGVEPMLDGAQPFFHEEVLPMLDRLGDLIDDLAAYEMPEVLPNGDILIRRRPDAPEYEADPEIGPFGDVEL